MADPGSSSSLSYRSQVHYEFLLPVHAHDRVYPLLVVRCDGARAGADGLAGQIQILAAGPVRVVPTLPTSWLWGIPCTSPSASVLNVPRNIWSLFLA